MKQVEFDHEDEVATMLRDAAHAFAPSDEFALSLEARLDAIDAPAPHRRSFTWRVASAIAALFALVAFLATYALWPATPTLADVQAAVNAAPWIHWTMDNGKEWWASPALERHALNATKAERRLSYIDYTIGLRSTFYVGERVVFQDEVKAHERPRTAWDLIVGNAERQAAGTNKWRDHEVKRELEVVESRRLLRFDTYWTDPLGQKLLMRQLWADPATRLPVRVRERLQLGERKEGGPEFAEGRYEFPAEGPMNIFDLGAPRDAIIVKHVPFDPKGMDPRLVELLASIEQAEARFPDAFTLVNWKVDGSLEVVNRLQWSGHIEFDREQHVTDFSHCRIRDENFSSHADINNVVPSATWTAEQVLEWCSNSIPNHTGVYDGEMSYGQWGPYPASDHFSSKEPIKIDVRKDGKSGPLFNSMFWPTYMYWPFARFTGARGELTLIHQPPGAPVGAKMIRNTRGDERTEYVFDPAHDFLCVRQTNSKLRDGQWSTVREESLEDLVQLPGGQWVPTTWRLYQSGDAERGVSDSHAARRIAIVPMEPDDFPPETFDGAALLEKAKSQGAVVRTY